MPKTDVDVLIVGAGVAGLTALRELVRSGLDAVCVEARDRIGGRVLTFEDPLSPIPIELGAEFVHGRSAEIWDIARDANVAIYDCNENAVHLKDGRVEEHSEAWEQINEVTEDLKRRAARGEDPSFLEFVQGAKHSEFAKQVATSYVEGFNAAHKEKISIASLAQDAEAAEQIDGDSSFRIANGYHSIPKFLAEGVSSIGSRLRLNSVVTAVNWKPGSTEVYVRSVTTGAMTRIAASRVVVTVPLGVLKGAEGLHGGIRFEPTPVHIVEAMEALEFGQVVRIVLRFKEPWWEDRQELADKGFWLSQEKFFPTWWTTLPMRTPLLTGWSAGPHADELLGQTRDVIIMRALEDLERVSGMSKARWQEKIENIYFHNWFDDPFSRGAYSYVRAGAFRKRNPLAEPVDDTLFFAGEATELNGHGATVHGAIATGKRAAQQIMISLSK